MSASTISPLEQAIRESGEDWLIDLWPPPGDAIPHFQKTLSDVHQLAQVRLGNNAPDLSETAIVNEFRRNRQKVRAFFQALGGTTNPDMLLMVWRIIQGMEIKEIQLNYRRQQNFEVRVILESSNGEEDPPYITQKIQDFELFRHIGVFEIDNRPVFDGFYSLQIPSPEPAISQ